MTKVVKAYYLIYKISNRVIYIGEDLILKFCKNLNCCCKKNNCYVHNILKEIYILPQISTIVDIYYAVCIINYAMANFYV